MGKKEKFKQWSNGHRWPPPFKNENLGLLFDDKNNRLFYAWREFDDVASSLVQAIMDSGRTKLDDLSPDALKSNTWEQLIETGAIEKRLLHRWVTPSQLHLTPYEAWKEHVAGWLSYAENHSDNVYPVKYEDLREDFQGTMSAVASWLGVELKSFENFTEKADKSPVRTGGYQP
jgi:hypothetical protein